jgi:molecular chaperone GrpE
MKKDKKIDQPVEEQARPADSEHNPVMGPLADTPEITSGQPLEGEAGGGPFAVEDPCQAVKESLAAREKDFEMLTDRFLRLAAEYDNFRKRSQKEKDALYADSIVLVFREFLPVLDNFDRAEWAARQYDHEDTRKIAEGIALIHKQVEQILCRLGIERIDCVGQPFDPALHEAVVHVQDEKTGEALVIEELQKGYRRDDRIIRHCMVKVAN